MLTRYRELYNNLTGFKAFSEIGAMDNTKVNKSTFTPNNLKAIILGANGAVAVYFTTNNTNTKRVSYLSFTKLPRTEEELAQSLKSEKGMVDALCDGLKFSNIEEIFLCTEGFNPIDAEKEYARLLAFANNKLLIQKSFKRLRGIALIKAPLTPDYASNINNESTIAAQLKKANLPTQALASFEPETNDLGLLKNIELDNGEYKLDAKFNPDADAKERDSLDCRLSRYFYMLEQKARKVKGEADKAQTTKEEVEIDKVAIEINLNRIMKVYKDLYSSCFGLKKPYGLLVKGGILTIKDGVTVVEKSQMYTDLYTLTVASSDYDIKAIAQQEGISKDDLYKVPLNGTYFPLFHLAVLFGRTPNWVFKSWNKPETRKLKDGSSIKTTLENEISKLLRKKLEETVRNSGELNDISDKLCTSFVVTELAKAGNGTPLMFKIKFSAGNAKFNQDTFINIFKNGGDKYLAGDAKITPFKPKPTGVAKINLCLNEEVYQKMPLFGYEAVEHKKANGEMVGIENCIIGQTREDEILTMNLKGDNNCKIINIMAGPRSGKGVLTQSLEGAILADGCPLIYMDAKPDMATVLNEVANKNGLRVAAWDLNTPPLEYLKGNTNTLSEEVRTKLSTLGSAAPNLIRNKSGRSTWGLLAYLKIMQLTAVSAIMQLDGKITASGKGNAFFVLDELLRVMAELDVFNKLLSNMEKDKEIDETNKNWAKEMRKWIEALGTELYGAAQSEIPKSNTNIICIYQEPTPFRDENIVTNVFRPYVRANTTTRLVGGQGANLVIEGIKALQGDDKAGINLVSNYYHFAKFTGSSLTKGGANYEIFKPYLVLNDADPNGEYVTKMAENIGTEAYKDLLERGGGTVPKGVGFEGYMESIGDNGIQNLSKGYEYLTAMLEATGLSRKYSCIEEYLYDADISSFYERNVLVEGRAGEVVEVNKPKSDGTSSGSWNLDESEEEINLFDSGNTSNAEFSTRPQAQQTVNSTQTQTGPKPHPQLEQSGQYQQQTARPQAQKYTDVHREGKTLDFKHDPIKANHTFIKSIDAINAMKTITKYILKDINKYYGGVDAIKSFTITDDGILIFNEKAYAPMLDEKFINNFEDEEIRTKLKNGYLADLFFIKDVFKFKNLKYFEIEDEDYANDTVRLGLGIKGKSFSILYGRFPKLKDIIIGGIPYVRGNVVNQKEQEFIKPRPRLADLRDTASAINNYQVNPNTLMGKVWTSRPVKTLVCAFGWTMGAQVVFTAATLFGPIGLLFGAFALSKAYSDYKKEHPDPPQKGQKQRQKGKGNYTRDYQYDDYDDYDYDRQGRRPNHNVNYRNNQNGQSRSNNNRNNRQHNSYYK